MTVHSTDATPSWQRLRRIFNRTSLEELKPLLRMHLPLIVILLSALGTGLLLIPNPDQAGLLDLASGRVHAGIARLEKSVASGKASRWAIHRLAEAQIETGNVEAGVHLLERLRRLHPDDLDLMRTLAADYYGLDRLKDYVAALEDLQKLAPTSARQHEIVRRYAELGEVKLQRKALWKLVREFKAQPDDYADLARLEAGNAKPLLAVAALNLLQARDPSAIGRPTIKLYINMLLTVGAGNQALATARSWLKNRPSAAYEIGEVFSDRSQYRLATALLRKYGGPDATLPILAALASDEYELGNLNEARLWLHRFEKKSGPGLKDQTWRLRLALEIGARESAFDAVRMIGIRRLAPSLLEQVVSFSLESGNFGLLHEIRSRAPSGFLKTRPLIAAQLDYALGYPVSARRLSVRALSSLDGSSRKELELARLATDLGRKDVALAALRLAIGLPRSFVLAHFESTKQDVHAVRDDTDAHFPGMARAYADLRSELRRQVYPVPADILGNIARLYVRLGYREEGNVVLDTLKRTQPSAQADRAWALAAAAAGKERNVVRWLATPGRKRELSSDFLKALADFAFAGRSYVLASEVSSRLVAKRGSDADKIFLAEVRLKAGQPWSPASDGAPASQIPVPAQPE